MTKSNQIQLLALSLGMLFNGVVLAADARVKSAAKYKASKFQRYKSGLRAPDVKLPAQNLVGLDLTQPIETEVQFRQLINGHRRNGITSQKRGAIICPFKRCKGRKGYSSFFGHLVSRHVVPELKDDLIRPREPKIIAVVPKPSKKRVVAKTFKSVPVSAPKKARLAVPTLKLSAPTIARAVIVPNLFFQSMPSSSVSPTISRGDFWGIDGLEIRKPRDL